MHSAWRSDIHLVEAEQEDMVAKTLLQHLPQSCSGIVGQGTLLAFALIPT